MCCERGEKREAAEDREDGHGGRLEEGLTDRGRGDRKKRAT